MKNTYNTIIIGAGPAGLIVGRYLEDALILDKKKEIGKPVQCGEGLSYNALEMQEIKPDPSWISCEINNVQRITPNSKIIGRSHKNLGYVIDRWAFENFLAKQSKAEIKLNTRVVDLKKVGDFWEVVTENDEVLKSKYLIGADGVHSIVRRLIFQQEVEIIPALDYLVELEKEINTETMKIYLDNERYPDGYAWVFPKSKNTANIGLGGRGNLSEKFNWFMKEKIAKDYGNYRILENKSGAVPIRKENSTFFKDNVLLLGDAAGLADPIFKGGVNQAMLSAKIASQCILENKVEFYEEKIKSMPFADEKLLEARKIFYSFDNQALNELGEILEERGTSYLKTLPGIIKLLSKPHSRKNIFDILKFFSIWRKNRDYLW